MLISIAMLEWITFVKSLTIVFQNVLHSGGKKLSDLCPSELQVSAVMVQLHPATMACIVGGSIVNQSLGCFCLTQMNVTKDMIETNLLQFMYIVDRYK